MEIDNWAGLGYYIEVKALKRYPKPVLRKYFAKQMVFPMVSALDEPHQVVRCEACDDAKHLEFYSSNNGRLHYRCRCGYESLELGSPPARLL